MLIHRYFGVDLEAVWRVVDVDAPALLAIIEKLIAEVDARADPWREAGRQVTLFDQIMFAAAGTSRWAATACT